MNTIALCFSAISILILGFMAWLVKGSNPRERIFYSFNNCRGDFGGAEGESGKSSEEQYTSNIASPEEKEYNKMVLENQRQLNPQMQEMNKAALALGGQLLKGGQLPGYLQNLPGGISEQTTKNIVDRSLKDVSTTAQYSGILDSGTTGQLAMKTAADIRAESERYNLDLLYNLLNLALGGTGSVQQPILSESALLSQRLAGLRNQQTNANREYSKFGWNAQADFTG